MDFKNLHTVYMKTTYLSALLLMLAVSAPFAASAATSTPPTCTLTATTQSKQTWPMLNGKIFLIAYSGEPFNVTWNSTGALRAYSSQNESITLNGTQKITPSQTATYTYTFTNGSRSATCTVTAVVLPGAVQGSQGSVTVPSTPVTVISTGTSTPSSGSFAVSEIPLLAGGYAGAGASVPVQYLKVTNVSGTNTTLPGIWVKQYGSAPDSSIIGFTTVDDKAISRTMVGGTEGSTPFVNHIAYIPLNSTFATGQFRIFTIKALISRNVSSYVGNSLMIDVSAINTTGKVGGAFPIHGTTLLLRN
jgi:hypothetical protein